MVRRFLPLLLFVCSVGWASVLSTDAFTYSNGDLATVGTDWVAMDGAVNVDSNHYHPAAVGVNSYYRSGISWPDDQYSQIETYGFSYGSSIGPTVRNSETDNFYYYHVRLDWRGIVKSVGGSETTVAGATASPESDTTNIYYLSAVGTTLTPKIGGSLDTAVGTGTDAALTSGAAGVGGSSNYSLSQGDNFEGGDFGTPPTSTPTNTATPTFTYTPTPTYTFTPTPTFTFTPTPAGVARVFDSLIFHSPILEGGLTN